jgi:hypothetical protein
VSRRVLRRLLSPAAAASLVFCLCASSLWVYSHFDAKGVKGHDFEVGVEAGRLKVLRVYEVGQPMTDEDWSANVGGLPTYRRLPQRRYAAGPFTLVIGQERRLERREHRHPRPVSFWAVGLPLWFVVLVGVPLPVVAVLRLRLRRRTALRGRQCLCLVCGYDLRASGGRCPECGAPARATPA